MPPKKDEASLRADVRLYRQWAEVKLDVLRARTGCGFLVKLRQTRDEEEKTIHNWLVKHGSRALELPWLRQDLEALDALVSSGAMAGQRQQPGAAAVGGTSEDAGMIDSAGAEAAPLDGPSGAPWPASPPHGGPQPLAHTSLVFEIGGCGHRSNDLREWCRFCMVHMELREAQDKALSGSSKPPEPTRTASSSPPAPLATAPQAQPV